MIWKKKGIIQGEEINISWSAGRAIAPIPLLQNNNMLRIYFSTLDEKGRSLPIFIETNAELPNKIQYTEKDPILTLGNLGSFDDSGITVSSIVEIGNRKYLYYIGWNPQKNVSYKLAIGLAISEDDGPYQKISEGPIMDRSIDEPYFNTAPCVILDGGIWRMWYVSCYGWKMVNNWPEPLYNIKYAVSNDGINWKRTGIVAIQHDEFAEAIGKPTVYIENGVYKMIYSYRNSVDYRTDPQKSYRLGYAESSDGINWTRMDDQVGISFAKEGWDSNMMEYASTYVYNNQRYMLYNGNGFGESGFGYAILKEK
ncbi:MAG: hypothetical protein ACQEWG_07225 [Bacteroidota bacterium]